MSRSLCTTVCKWTYLAHLRDESKRWSAEFFNRNGIGDLLRKNKIGRDIQPVGSRAGQLRPAAARALGLDAGTLVAGDMIDAHAGGLGVLGMTARGRKPIANDCDLDDLVCLIGGTSSCHMAVSRKARLCAVSGGHTSVPCCQATG